MMSLWARGIYIYASYVFTPVSLVARGKIVRRWSRSTFNDQREAKKREAADAALPADILCVCVCVHSPPAHTHTHIRTPTYARRRIIYAFKDMRDCVALKGPIGLSSSIYL